ncbi:ABC transporter ATP-binding protein [Streptomyces sp. BH105]|uniref:ABC transporter ATP-binding protein n=1 Tax=Streptomyces sp. BH105 TaxID=3410408 RepID=UPI003CF0A95C
MRGTRDITEAFRRFWPLTRGDRGRLVAIVGCVIVAALAETAAILLFAEITDHALDAGSLSAFWGPALAWLGAALVGAAVGYAGNSLAVWTAERFVMRLRAKVFSHLQELPPHFFRKHRRGDIVSRLTGDVEAIEQMVVSGVVGTVSAVFSALFYGAAALWLRWDLALATFVLAPLFLLAARRFSGRIGRAARDERAAEGAITSVVEESLGNVELTQAYNRHRAEELRLATEARNWMRASVRGARATEMYEQVVQVVETVCVLAVIGLGAWEISQQRLTLGQLLAFAAFIGYLYPPVRDLGQLGLTLTAATAGARRLAEILDARPAVSDPEVPTPRGSAPDPAPQSPAGLERPPQTPAGLECAHPGRITLDHVTHQYPDTVQAALHDVTMAAEPGELVLVTGPSGAGKSTLTQLLVRFYDPTSGVVRLDGVPLPELPLTHVRDRITLLPQRTHVLHGTIRENIAAGRPDASDAEVERAARDADAHAFITALPDGYAAQIAPGTAALSGGQLQRIAIARAMLRPSPVLVLDEPTTGLDAESAHRVVEPLRRLMRNRTTILITHDLTLAPYADRVLFLDEGRIAESGARTQPLSRTVPRAHPELPGL